MLVQVSITASFLIMAHIFKMTHIFLGSNPWGKPFFSAVHVFWHLQSEVFKDRDFEQLVVLYLVAKKF